MRSIHAWLFCAVAGLTAAAASAAEPYRLKFAALDMQRVAAEDLARTGKPNPMRFAIPHDITVVPGKQGAWADFADGTSEWRIEVSTPDAVHLNFGFTRFQLPPSGELTIESLDGKHRQGPWRHADNPVTGQLWTQILEGNSAVMTLRVASAEKSLVDVALGRVGHGYTGFGFTAKHCKSGACNTDVACLGDTDPWNENRRSVAAITLNGTDNCTGSLVNNTAGDRRLLFATATHCGINAGNVATLLAYFNYESPTCRTPGSTDSGTPVPRPNTTLAGQSFVASTASPFGGGTAGPRSDWTLLQLASSPSQNSLNLFWAGWDRRPPPTTCTEPATPSGTAGLCASIHHPGVDEKRITFVQESMIVDNISGGVNVHWRANWDPTPPILPNVPAPQPTTLPPSVTEPGSSGSPLYNADRRLVGVLSGGPSACGATGASLRDQYGGLFHAWEGGGSATTRMRDHLDPGASNPDFIDGIGQCTPPAAPTGLAATPNGNNRIDLSWTAVAGAERYRVFRGGGACPGSGFAQIAEVTTTSYSDLTVSGGSAYSYRVAAFDDGEACLSQQGTCSSATATGACTLAPTFAGLASAQSAGTASCGINLAWATASGNCGAGSAMRYNVFRSTTAGFTPAPANRIAQCATATTLADSGVMSGTRYHYVVRAEDLGATGSGVCGGIEESNAVSRSAVPGGPFSGLSVDNIESGSGNFAVDGSGAGADFSIVTTQANSPTSSLFVPDPPAVSDRRLTMVNAIPVSAGGPATLSFFHRFDTEASTASPTVGFDGGVLEYSLDNGATWTDILAAQGSVPANAARLTAGGYVRTISSSFSSPIAGRQAWSGTSGGAAPAWIQTTVSLADFVGSTLLLRLRFASDSSVSDAGWWVDDVQVAGASACTTGPGDPVFSNGFETPALSR